jgi:amino acid permease
MGTFGIMLVKIVIIVGNFGFVSVFFRIIYKCIDTILEAMKAPNNLFRKDAFIMSVVFVVSLPFVLINKSSIIKIASLIGVFGLVVFCFLVIFAFFAKLIAGEIQFTSKMLVPGENVGKLDMISNLPTAILAFSFQYNTFPIFYSIRNRNNQIMKRATTKAIIICFILYASVGIFGYLMYFKESEDNVKSLIIENMKDDLEDMSRGFKFFLYIIGIACFTASTLSSIPITFFSCKKLFLHVVLLIKKKRSKGQSESNIQIKKWETIVYPLVLYFASFGLTLLVEDITTLFNFIGSTSSSLISLILPAVFLLILVRDSGRKNGIASSLISLLFGLLGIFSFYVPKIIELFMKDNNNNDQLHK